ncbi:hypothetical protein [Lactococcus lactis]|uniref:hypothetical protein n=1 Tax=Lactococcus lactis TaxID=1358 RepID=UPI00241797CB|nr:hypothetical protein [Lactococcus lactis]MDG4957481.1 hypothetical protein [Lactococcus lactis]
MPDFLQEPKKYKVKNGTENDIWDETQLPALMLGAVLAMFTSLFVVPIDLVRYAWVAFFVGLTFTLTMRSVSNKNMRNWQVIYAYLFSQKGRYDLTKNTKIEE